MFLPLVFSNSFCKYTLQLKLLLENLIRNQDYVGIYLEFKMYGFFAKKIRVWRVLSFRVFPHPELGDAMGPTSQTNYPTLAIHTFHSKSSHLETVKGGNGIDSVKARDVLYPKGLPARSGYKKCWRLLFASP
jgi:hypothetical protein